MINRDNMRFSKAIWNEVAEVTKRPHASMYSWVKIIRFLGTDHPFLSNNLHCIELSYCNCDKGRYSDVPGYINEIKRSNELREVYE